jgi:hypothetical protein
MRGVHTYTKKQDAGSSGNLSWLKGHYCWGEFASALQDRAEKGIMAGMLEVARSN